MNIDELKLWRSPGVCWIFFWFFLTLAILWQFVEEVPNPHRNQHVIIGNLILFGAAILCFVLARIAKKKAVEK